MRATERLQLLAGQDHRRSGLRTARDAVYWLCHGLLLLVGVAIYGLYRGDDLRTVNDSLIAATYSVISFLGTVVLVLVVAGARPAPLASAAFLPFVFLWSLWEGVSPAIPALVWVIGHGIVVVVCLRRRPACTPATRVGRR